MQNPYRRRVSESFVQESPSVTPSIVLLFRVTADVLESQSLPSPLYMCPFQFNITHLILIFVLPQYSVLCP